MIAVVWESLWHLVTGTLNTRNALNSASEQRIGLFNSFSVEKP